MMKQRVTLKDIAQAAGVSTNTVSFVLHHTSTNVRVAPATAERIKQLAVEFGYKSNREARALIATRFNKRVRYHLIALYINVGAPYDNFIIDPYFSKHILGVLAESASHETDIVLCHANARFAAPFACGRARRRRHQPGQSSTFAAISRLELPAVTIGHTIDPSLNDTMHNITADSIDGVRQTTRHLLALGHRRIAYLGQSLVFPEAVLRFQGYCREMDACGAALIPAYQETLDHHAIKRRRHRGDGTLVGPRPLLSHEWTSVVHRGCLL